MARAESLPVAMPGNSKHFPSLYISAWDTESNHPRIFSCVLEGSDCGVLVFLLQTLRSNAVRVRWLALARCQVSSSVDAFNESRRHPRA